ncbi:MAG TPA: hypothetical protein VNO21_24870 [Polyangiaceae bacterium]|nr:hypothetical protein [Polyangiaceae bacterium]
MGRGGDAGFATLKFDRNFVACRSDVVGMTQQELALVKTLIDAACVALETKGNELEPLRNAVRLCCAADLALTLVDEDTHALKQRTFKDVPWLN